MGSMEARAGSQTGEEEISLALIVEMLRGQMTQTNTFLERMDKRRQGLWADQEEPEVMDGSALEDQCWTGDKSGHVGGDCPSSEVDSEECGLEEPRVAETEANAAKSDVEKPEKPAECVLSAAVVPCMEPLASRPLSSGTQDEELVKSGADVAESEEPAVCGVVAAVDVPCVSPLVSEPLSLGAQEDCRTNLHVVKPSVQKLVRKRTKPGDEARRLRTVISFTDSFNITHHTSTPSTTRQLEKRLSIVT
ncbi:Hypothetical predicted protein [Octopus vulgaris]|uniref:Uncharacterized protein n=1 Tax=Octopus vulgaris TaxID=6645 RepID=A0AA36B650_OCTVU|nr:Hypothetical predicted protein [Octopus vulgaris]